MTRAASPAVYSIPHHRAFADALVAGVMATHGADAVNLARGLVLVPSHRAGQSIRDAFVRVSDAGLLLPRIVTIGDVDSDEAVGLLFDGVDETAAIPPAVDPLQRQLILARLIQQSAVTDGQLSADQAMRLAADLGHVLDQLLIERVDPARLRTIAQGDLSKHWQASLDLLTVILDQWPSELARLGRIDRADRRNRQLDRMVDRWRSAPPPGYVIAAGISMAAPAVAALLKTIAWLPRGQVVFAGLDLVMPDEEWQVIGGSETEPALETHPQFLLHRLLDRMGLARADVKLWRWGSEADARATRTRAISNAMAPARFTGKWAELERKDRDVGGVRALELDTPADEAQAIAILLRGALEEPGRTAALVTPDRALATRVAAHLRRWGIAADDSAGQPLSATPAGTLILAVAHAIAERFAPVPLLTLLKHPLVRKDADRLAWLDGVRSLDRALRGPRPADGLAGLTAFLSKGEGRDAAIRAQAQMFWTQASPLLAPLEFDSARQPDLAQQLGLMRELLEQLAGDAAWRGEAGRAAADLFMRLEQDAGLGPALSNLSSLPLLLRQLFDATAVRPAVGGHPRLFIWGLIEARLQSAHLMILGGLNEGVWPPLPAPDPWLAPQIRKMLGLAGLEQRIGASAHDLASALGAPELILTRAHRDASAPTIASRFWLRIAAMTGGLPPPALRADRLAEWIDRSDAPAKRARRPAPRPPLSARPVQIRATLVDLLKADPYAFYAQVILGLTSLDRLDAPVDAAWRGSLIHRMLEDWANSDDYRRDALRARAEALFAQPDIHPLLRSLWQPRLIEAAEYIADKVTDARQEGRVPLVAEQSGRIEIGGISLIGRVDRIDRLPDGGLAIIDYKTGTYPSNGRIRDGFALQLGLMGLMAARGGFTKVAGTPERYEYWLLSRNSSSGTFGSIRDISKVLGNADESGQPDLALFAQAQLIAAIERWLTGNEPFLAKQQPAYAPYDDYEHLMRYEEWLGRE